MIYKRLQSISYNHLNLLWYKSYLFIQNIVFIRGDFILYLKKYGTRLFYNILELIILLFFITILYYFNIINDGTYSALKLIILLLSIFINSFILGLNTNNKKYIEGIKYGIILIILLFIPTIILNSFKMKVFIYYLLIIITSMFGSMFSIIKKKK